MSTPFDGLKVIRERILVNHQSPYERTVHDEITLINTSSRPITNVFVFKKDFMPSLKVLDESGKELPYHTNEFTKQMLRDFIERFPEQNPQLVTMLREINEQKLYVVWIKLSKNDAVPGGGLKIIKLSYHDNRSLKAIQKKIQKKIPQKKFAPNFWQYIKRQKFLFSIPTFFMDYEKSEGEQHDMFFVIFVPEGYVVKHDVIKNIKIRLSSLGMVRIPDIGKLSDRDRYYVNDHDRIISIRLPPIPEIIDYEVHYEVVPEPSERFFFSSIVAAITAASIFFLWIGTAPLYNPNPPVIMRMIYPHLLPLFGGTITAALAAIGLMAKPFLGKTRFYLIPPIGIIILGFLIKELIALPK